MNKAIKELLEIIKIEGDGFRSGYSSRKIALERWIDTWVMELENEQLVTDSKYLSAEFKDLLTKVIISDIMENVIEDFAERKVDQRRISVKLLMLRKNERVKASKQST